jgi:hypothetical protein
MTPSRHVLLLPRARLAQINQLDRDEAAAKDKDEVQKGARLTTGALQSLLVKEEMSFPSLKLHQFFLLSTLLMWAR